MFVDFYKEGTNYFKTIAETPLRRMIFEEFTTPQGRALLLSHKIADKIVQRYYDVKEFKDAEDAVRNKELRWKLEMLQLIFKSGLVLLAEKDVNYFDDHDVDLVPNINALLVVHPFLLEELKLGEHKDQKELGYLHMFLNYIRIALPIIPAASNKHLLLKIIERLEGSNNHYVCGGGMKPAVRRRIRLIETEGNSPAVMRLNRKKNKRVLREQELQTERDESEKRKRLTLVNENSAIFSSSILLAEPNTNKPMSMSVGDQLAWSLLALNPNPNAAPSTIPESTSHPSSVLRPSFGRSESSLISNDNPLWNLIEAAERQDQMYGETGTGTATGTSQEMIPPFQCNNPFSSLGQREQENHPLSLENAREKIGEEKGDEGGNFPFPFLPAMLPALNRFDSSESAVSCISIGSLSMSMSIPSIPASLTSSSLSPSMFPRSPVPPVPVPEAGATCTPKDITRGQATITTFSPKKQQQHQQQQCQSLDELPMTVKQEQEQEQEVEQGQEQEARARAMLTGEMTHSHSLHSNEPIS